MVLTTIRITRRTFKAIELAGSDVWISLEVDLFDENDAQIDSNAITYPNITENSVLKDDLKIFGVSPWEPHVVKAVYEMQRNDSGEANEQTAEIKVPPHISCKTTQKCQASSATGFSQSELKQKLAALDGESEVLKQFEDHKCSVCLSDYKEIIEEGLHVVAPSCGHPLCCSCADNIVESAKKECPQCRGSVTAQSFNLVMFDSDLEVDASNQKLFL